MASKRDLFKNNQRQVSVIKQQESVIDELMVDPGLEKTETDNKDKYQFDVLLYGSPDIFTPHFDSDVRLKLHTGEKREQLLESIKAQGIVAPVLTTVRNNELMIISGHNRVDIAKELGIKVPYIIKETSTDADCIVMAADENLLNRQYEEFLPSEFAKLLKKKVDAEKEIATVKPFYTTKSTATTAKVSKEHGLSRQMVCKYLKLNDLVATATTLLDEKVITIRTAYELAFFDERVQHVIVNMMNNYVINEKNLKQLRKGMADKEFNNEEDLVQFIKLHVSSKESKKRKFDYRNVKTYLPEDIKDNEVEDYIIEALKMYKEYNEKNK